MLHGVAGAPEGEHLLNELVMVTDVFLGVRSRQRGFPHQFFFVGKMLACISCQAQENRLQLLLVDVVEQQQVAKLVRRIDQVPVL
jgi:hypothetical protein